MPRLVHNEDLRNIAIISHVDHGKTTLVDALFRQSGLFRADQAVAERLMDSMDLERERGITIAAKNCAIVWKEIRINIIDTPGHADFGGEVERALSMADGAILLVDAAEGPLPQTRFVLKKALATGLKIIVVINKVDRHDARPEAVLDEIYDLLIDLDASENQLDFPLLYAIGRDGIATRTLEEKGSDLHALLDTIVAEIPAPSYNPDAPFQMLVSDLGYSDYLGRLAVGKIFNGTARSKDDLVCLGEAGSIPLKVSKLQIHEGTGLVDAETVLPGDIVVLAGIEDVRIGDTICHGQTPRALPRIRVDKPTVSMKFTINNSPLGGKEGKYVQSSRLRERLKKETLRNVAIEVEATAERDTTLVKGRGEFQLAILIETMRREGFEFCVGRPEVVYRNKNGICLEPVERLWVDCEERFLGVVTEKLALRKGKMLTLSNNGKGRARMNFSIPTRTLIGYRDEFLTDTRGTGIMHALAEGYEAYRGDCPSRFTGSIVSDRAGHCVAYALFNLEPRGRLFLTPGAPVYEGMIVGEHNRGQDITVNPCKEKKLTNMRAAGKDDNVMLSPVKPMTLEEAISFIREDELVEVTPLSIRLRKTELSGQKRHAQRGRLMKRE
jgi:GTP-binding protein